MVEGAIKFLVRKKIKKREEVGGIVVSLLNYLCSPFFFCDDECYLIFCLWCKKQMFRVYSLLLLFLEISVVK